jgi:membrane protease YdiL (CAAX protease family)
LLSWKSGKEHVVAGGVNQSLFHPLGPDSDCHAEDVAQHLLMRKLLWGLAVFFCVWIVGTALVAPAVYSLLGVWGWETIPFRRIFNRVLMVWALVLLVPLAWYWGVRSWRAVGLVRTRWKEGLVRGGMLGIASMVLLVGLHLLAGSREWQPQLTAAKALEFTASALAVGFFEEILFRGMLVLAVWHLVGRKQTVPLVFGSALLFATVHFLKVPDLAGPVGWTHGWQSWAGSVPSSELWSGLAPRWVSLLWVGFILSAVVVRTGSLWPAIGLHAGWVWVRLLASKLTGHGDGVGLWFGNEFETGLVPLAVLTALLVWWTGRPGHVAGSDPDRA